MLNWLRTAFENYLFVISLAGALLAPAIAVIVVCWRKGKSATIKGLLVMLFFSGVATGAAQKGDTLLRLLTNIQSPIVPAPTISPLTTDIPANLLPSDMSFVSNLCVCAIQKTADSAFVGIAWPYDQHYVNDYVDIFGAPGLSEGSIWTQIAAVDISSASSNAVVRLYNEDFPTNSMEIAAFFRVASQVDSDGDGMSDAYERFVSGTDPHFNDTDTDGDGFPDLIETGYAESFSGPDFLWLDLDSGLSNVSHFTTARNDYCDLWLDEYVSIFNIDCNLFAFHIDGCAVLSHDGDLETPNYSDAMFEMTNIATQAKSGGAPAVVAMNCDLQSMPAWDSSRVAGVVETNGNRFAVYKAEKLRVVGVGNDFVNAGVTYEVIIPFNETNTIYVSYLHVGSNVTNLNMDLGVQCSSMRSSLNTNEFYCVVYPGSGPRPQSRTTIKYVLGMNTNPQSADDYDAPTLSVTANTNAYCTVTIAAGGSDVEVRFAGDGPSDLPDPHFYMRGGSAAEVLILKGKTYSVTSTGPITCTAYSDSCTEITNVTSTSMTIVRPVTITCTGAPGAFTMLVDPSDLGGSFIWTNGCCQVSGANGSYECSCSYWCSCEGCYASGRYTYEGYSIATTGGRCSCQTEEENPVALSIAFSSDMMFYEDTYTNTPTDIVQRRSTTNTLAGTIYGGRFGGNCSITITNGDKLERVGGDNLSYSIYVGAGETRNFSAQYTALDHSLSADDIVATATFTQYFTGHETVADDKTTAMEILISPLVTVGNAIRRHTFGVGERAWCDFYPQLPMVGVSMLGDGEMIDLQGRKFLTCALMPEENYLCITNGNTLYFPEVSTIAPTGVVASGAIEFCYTNAQTGVAGWAGMSIELSVVPDTVCFTGIAMEEVPTYDYGPTGYFNQPYFEDVWYHLPSVHAGEWHRIGGQNRFMTDEAYMAFGFPSNWATGSIVWDIPIAWGEVNNIDPYIYMGILPMHYSQVFTMTDNGVFRVSKFQYWVERRPDGTRDRSEGIQTCVVVE